MNWESDFAGTRSGHDDEIAPRSTSPMADLTRALQRYNPFGPVGVDDTDTETDSLVAIRSSVSAQGSRETRRRATDRGFGFDDIFPCGGRRRPPPEPGSDALSSYLRSNIPLPSPSPPGRVWPTILEVSSRRGSSTPRGRSPSLRDSRCSGCVS